ncbi:major capsid protein, partial [Escherichia coli]
RQAESVGARKHFENSYWRYEGCALGDPDLYAAVDESAVTIA